MPSRNAGNGDKLVPKEKGDMMQTGIRPATTLLSAALGAVALGVLGSGAAFAATISFSGISATWQNVAPPGVQHLGFVGNGTGDARVNWGTDEGSGQSGYEFQAPGVQPVTAIVPPTPSSDFVLGTFTHHNNPIAATPTPASITGIQLAVQMDVNIDSTDLGNRIFLFDFLHDETPNGSTGDTCPFGSGRVGIGSPSTNVNFSGCADRVRVGVDTATASFLIGTDVYTVNITGFQVSGVTQTQFLTREGADNAADLVADVTLKSLAVPAPKIGSGAAAIVLLVGGLGFAGARRGWLRRAGDHLGAA
jgi:hypothetical protein